MTESEPPKDDATQRLQTGEYPLPPAISERTTQEGSGVSPDRLGPTQEAGGLPGREPVDPPRAGARRRFPMETALWLLATIALVVALGSLAWTVTTNSHWADDINTTTTTLATVTSALAAWMSMQTARRSAKRAAERTSHNAAADPPQQTATPMASPEPSESSLPKEPSSPLGAVRRRAAEILEDAQRLRSQFEAQRRHQASILSLGWLRENRWFDEVSEEAEWSVIRRLKGLHDDVLEILSGVAPQLERKKIYVDLSDLRRIPLLVNDLRRIRNEGANSATNPMGWVPHMREVEHVLRRTDEKLEYLAYLLQTMPNLSLPPGKPDES